MPFVNGREVSKGFSMYDEPVCLRCSHWHLGRGPCKAATKLAGRDEVVEHCGCPEYVPSDRKGPEALASPEFV